MNPMAQEPDATVEAVVLKERWSSSWGSGYTLAQRAAGTSGWYVIANDLWSEKLDDFGPFEGWWPLDIRSVIDE